MTWIKEGLYQLKDLDETHFRKDKLDSHYDNHVSKNSIQYLLDFRDELFEPMDKETYDKNGDELSKQKVNSSNYESQDDVIGFVGKNNVGEECVYKFRKSTSDLVIYKSNKNFAYTLTYFKVSTESQKERYNKLKRKHYLRDVTPEDDLYNK